MRWEQNWLHLSFEMAKPKSPSRSQRRKEQRQRKKLKRRRSQSKKLRSKKPQKMRIRRKTSQRKRRKKRNLSRLRPPSQKSQLMSQDCWWRSARSSTAKSIQVSFTPAGKVTNKLTTLNLLNEAFALRKSNFEICWREVSLRVFLRRFARPFSAKVKWTTK